MTFGNDGLRSRRETSRMWFMIYDCWTNMTLEPLPQIIRVGSRNVKKMHIS